MFPSEATARGIETGKGTRPTTWQQRRGSANHPHRTTTVRSLGARVTSSGVTDRSEGAGMAAGTALSDQDLLELMDLIKGADSVELKLTIHESARADGARALGVDPLDSQIRQVFFFDTPDLALNGAGVVVRARRRQNEQGDTVIKLRPVVPNDLPEDLRAMKTFNVEVDAMPGGFVCSASFKGAADNTAILEAATGDRPIRKLFSKVQRAFYNAHAPDGIELDSLSVLGPIPVIKVKVSPEGFGRRLV
ncbi:MAG TPA: hypothetical protein VFP13_00790, partial [Actinomycetota bacterium]|nr:hypothetical protein [Actinomycetota bacterium]